jgi:uncharacterized protein YecE (DUF72 family)
MRSIKAKKPANRPKRPELRESSPGNAIYNNLHSGTQHEGTACDISSRLSCPLRGMPEILRVLKSRLKAFFKKLPRVSDYRFAVEIRNKYWLKPRLLDVLRENNVALVLQDQSWMPHPKELENHDLITADFSYIRWLGNRKDIEKLTTTWNTTIIDRTADLQTWVDVCEKIQKRGITQYVYANNHYSGFAPATVELFRSLCKARGIETPLNVKVPAVIEPRLFDISPN